MSGFDLPCTGASLKESHQDGTHGVKGDTETTLVFTFKRNLRGDFLTILHWATDKSQRNFFDSNGESMRGIGQNMEQWKINKYFFSHLEDGPGLAIVPSVDQIVPRPPNYSTLPIFLLNFCHYFLLLKRSILCVGLYSWCYNKKPILFFYIFILHYG